MLHSRVESTACPRNTFEKPIMADESLTPEEYVADLMERLDNQGALPHIDCIKTSADTVSWQARKEIGELDNPALIPVIHELVRKAKKVGNFQKLKTILVGLIKNTRHPDAIATYESLMQRAPASDNLWMGIIDGAGAIQLEIAMPYALRIIAKPFKGGLALSSALGYLGSMGGVETIPLIGELLDNDCDGKCPPMYAASALAAIEHEDALPYLRRAIERHQKSRKTVSVEVDHLSTIAIERIETSPPSTLNGMQVCMWTVPPDVPERIAICSYEKKFATISSEASWQNHKVHPCDSREEAIAKSFEFAGTKQLSWHQRPWKG